ncbi:MAG: hypothetical protein VB049_02100 [Candidatus Pelethousia sp.]|nr:hypothetical protein [Candidatus Pelethousia sp.]
MCKIYCDIPPAGPNAPLHTEREVRYKSYSPKPHLKKENDSEEMRMQGQTSVTPS